MKLFLQILIFIGLKFKELLWNIVIACTLIVCGIYISIGAIAYNFVDLTSWGRNVYVLTDSHTFLNYIEVYMSLGGCLFAMVIGVAFALFIIFCSLWSLIKLIFSYREKYNHNKIKTAF